MSEQERQPQREVKQEDLLIMGGLWLAVTAIRALQSRKGAEDWRKVKQAWPKCKPRREGTQPQNGATQPLWPADGDSSLRAVMMRRAQGNTGQEGSQDG